MFRTLALLALFAAPVRADDKPKPNALTAKEIADGWILLFDGETTFGWDTGAGVFVNKERHLVLPSGKGTVATTKTSFGSGELKLVFSHTGTGDTTCKWGTRTESLSNIPSDANQTIRIGYKGPGAAPINLNTDEKASLVVAQIAYRPTTATSLFNGKDLTGWKVNGADPKRTASKWSVTKDGELAVKDGPGDLVCEKEFANFVLQFECKTNGKALNSGIFFRCIPGQYQNGYEAQIQNAYKDDDRTKPADFGTGAIYRRIAARKVVSNDNEWFTMTVAANGKHIATWVNGYQTVDWTDDRKENDNPRQGYRAAKGPLSIQGHDPTTDILFRNIRVSELPAK